MPILRITALAAAATIAAPACAQWNAVAYVDSQGRSWRQLSFSCGASWNQVASMCSSDGATPCAGVLNGHPIDGWVWATRAQVEALLVELGAAVDPADCATGPTADGCADSRVAGTSLAHQHKKNTAPDIGGSVFQWTVLDLNQ